MPRRKILTFDSLLKRRAVCREAGENVVLCYGVFGVLHVGHIRYLKQAREYGDFLVVVITPDERNDSESAERFEEMRAEALAHLDWIDAVSVDETGSFQKMIEALHPDVFVKGFESVNANEQMEAEIHDERICRDLGIEHVVAKEDNFTTADQINRYLRNYPDNVITDLSFFKQRYSIDDLLEFFDQIRTLKVLVIGDTILDEYHFCSAIGKSSKDPTLALKYEHSDMFAGGGTRSVQPLRQLCGSG